MSMGISLSSFENLHQRGGKSPRAPLPDAVSEPPASGATTESTGGQPVEFNHAILYVNKIKVGNLFQLFYFLFNFLFHSGLSHLSLFCLLH